MAGKILFITGHLAESRLKSVLENMEPEFQWRVLDIGVKVAALMTEDIILRRLSDAGGADKIMLPGRCRADLDRLSAHYGVPVERGPDEVKDIPVFFGRARRASDMSKYDIKIFAEIIDATAMSVEDILACAEDYAHRGADVIDLGCLPDTPFPHLEEAVKALKTYGYKVSVDSADPDELLRGGKAGADYLLSLDETRLDIAGEVSSVPVLIPATHGDMDSLRRAMAVLDGKGLPYLADPVLDPINFGFMASLERYAQLRRERPDAEILLGTGNLTELTEADTTGITAALIGIASELDIKNVLVVQVSPHTRRTYEEHDAARRLMFASRADGELPKGYTDELLGLHAKRPFPLTPDEIAENAAAVRDRNFRIEVAEDGVHIYNRDGHHVAQDIFEFFPKLDLGDDTGHAFYLAAELAKAEIAWRLGKRYAQDEPLDWGVAADRPQDDRTRLKEAGHTLAMKKKRDSQ
ncbi:MAG: dihydropteroate synthase [Methyloceanibacter sp.]|nr:MAG: dihydropteroate synthase [Methyloceanibacter sp.]